MNPDHTLHCQWHDQEGHWALTVSHNGHEWELFAAGPSGSESLPFAHPDEVLRLAQALLDMPAEPEPYEFEWELSRTEFPRTERERGHFATFAIGLDPSDDHRPYLAFQSYFHWGQTTALGMEVVCDDPPVDDLRAQAHAFLTGFPGPARPQP